MSLLLIQMLFVMLAALLTAYLTTLPDSMVLSFIIMAIGSFLSGSSIADVQVSNYQGAALLVSWIAFFAVFLIWFEF